MLIYVRRAFGIGYGNGASRKTWRQQLGKGKVKRRSEVIRKWSLTRKECDVCLRSGGLISIRCPPAYALVQGRGLIKV